MALPADPGLFERPASARPDTSSLLDLREYDHIIVSFSGGKDSMACIFRLLDLGVPLSRIELWHQAVDGLETDGRFFDWPCTEGFVKAFAAELRVPVFFQRKVGGFRGEMLREESSTLPTIIDTATGPLSVTGKPSPGTRLRFPPKVADLNTRWCSGYLKIDPAHKAFTNDPRFRGKKSLILTGERRQESKARSKYAEVEEYASAPTLGRRVDQWRAVINFTEEQVWEIISRYRFRPHPAYYLGWSRLSCMACIFGDDSQWASIAEIAPKVLEEIAYYEELFHDYWALRMSPARRGPDEKPFGGTIIPGRTVIESARRGVSYLRAGDEALVELCMAEGAFRRDLIRLDLVETWELPRGAFGKSGGPT